jgi:hypothetical protein
MDLPDDERAAVVAAMKDVERNGLVTAKHLRGDIHEVKADTADKYFRVLFAVEGRYNQVLLSLEGFAKKDARCRSRSCLWPSAGSASGGAGVRETGRRIPRSGPICNPEVVSLK